MSGIEQTHSGAAQAPPPGVLLSRAVRESQPARAIL